MGADVALLQEAGSCPADVAGKVDVGPDASWDVGWPESRSRQGRSRRPYDRAANVVKLSNSVDVEWFSQVGPVSHVADDEIAVSGIGTIAAARVTPAGSAPFIAVSMYARWLAPHPSTDTSWRVGCSDASAHRIISDLSAFIGSTDPGTHRIVAAGDLNTFHGAVDGNRLVLAGRDRTVFERMKALGLEFLGPQAPEGGRRPDPVPPGLRAGARNTPTFHAAGQTPSMAVHQLDYVFASRGFHEQVTVRALNSPDEWGASDHCRVLIEIEDG